MVYNIKKVKKMFLKKEITRCEICFTDNFLSFAHKHKRRWYLNQGNKINEFNQILLICVPCHIELEQDKELTEQTFKRLRP